MRPLLTALLLIAAHAVLAQKTIYAYAIGNWRNGPTVQMTDVFETTEQFTTEQIMTRVKAEYVAFKEITDTDLLLFTDTASAWKNQGVLIHKYGQRKLPVRVTSPNGTIVAQWPLAPQGVPVKNEGEAPAKP